MIDLNKYICLCLLCTCGSFAENQSGPNNTWVLFDVVIHEARQPTPTHGILAISFG